MRPLKTGLITNNPNRATNGYTLFAPLDGSQVMLIDMKGKLIHDWDIGGKAGPYGYLLPTGNLLCAVDTGNSPVKFGGKGGKIKELDWDGNLVWEHTDNAQHHDFRRLRNGNTIYVGWEKLPERSKTRVIGGQLGTEDNDGNIWGDYIKEVNPEGNIEWEWHVHQNMDIEMFPLHPLATRNEYAHCNACVETPDGDIMLSFRRISTILVIDKTSKTTKWHMRNDDWGQQHDCSILENGNILLYANGIHVPRGVFHSSVIEIEPQSKTEVWRYEDDPKWHFFSPNISGAQRLWSKNTLVCEGLTGRIFEVTPQGDIVWEYINPYLGPVGKGESNRVFRAYRYHPDSPELSQLN